MSILPSYPASLRGDIRGTSESSLSGAFISHIDSWPFLLTGQFFWGWNITNIIINSLFSFVAQMMFSLCFICWSHLLSGCENRVRPFRWPSAPSLSKYYAAIKRRRIFEELIESNIPGIVIPVLTKWMLAGSILSHQRHRVHLPDFTLNTIHFQRH